MAAEIVRTNTPQAPVGSTSPFAGIRHEDEKGEFWLGRELAPLLGYKAWQFFARTLAKAERSCAIHAKGQDFQVTDHFMRVHEMVHTGSGARRKIPNVRLTYHACILVAQNGDVNKDEIAAAQAYFSYQTYRAETLLPPIGAPSRPPDDFTALSTAAFQRLFNELAVTQQTQTELVRRVDKVELVGPAVADVQRQMSAIARDIPAFCQALGDVRQESGEAMRKITQLESRVLITDEVPEQLTVWEFSDIARLRLTDEQCVDHSYNLTAYCNRHNLPIGRVARYSKTYGWTGRNTYRISALTAYFRTSPNVISRVPKKA